MIILMILKYLLFTILLSAALVLIIPVQYSASGSKAADYRLKAEISWLYRLVNFSFVKDGSGTNFSVKILGLCFPGRSSSEPGKQQPREEEESKKRKSGKAKGLKWLQLFFKKEILTNAVMLAKNVLTVLKPKVFTLTAVFGFEDPYYTGLVCALLSSFHPLLKHYRVSYRPVFDEEILQGGFTLQGRIILGVIVYLAVKFVLALPLIKIFKLIKEEKAYAV